jgi:hypothetical protein
MVGDIYPGGGHVLYAPMMQRESMRRNLDWFTRWILAALLRVSWVTLPPSRRLRCGRELSGKAKRGSSQSFGASGWSL